MTQTARHIQLAERYLQTAASFQSGGYNNEAAEMVWGAIVNAIESIGHLETGNSNRNLSNKARRDWPATYPPQYLKNINPPKPNSTTTFTTTP